MFSTIVHPTDLSEASIPALKTAQELAKALGGRLIVCYVAHPPLVASGDTLTNPKTNETRDIAAELESHQPSDPSVQRELRLVVMEQSARVKQLLGFLQEMNSDLLVLGMHRRAGMAGWLSSSITEEVVRLAECAVMVVKQHRSGNADEEADEKVGEADTDEF